MIYGCETWATAKDDHIKFSTTEKKVLAASFLLFYNIETGKYVIENILSTWDIFF